MSLSNKVLANLASIIANIKEKEIKKDKPEKVIKVMPKSTKAIKKNFTLEQQYYMILEQINEYNISVVSFCFLENEYKYTTSESFAFFMFCYNNSLLEVNKLTSNSMILSREKVAKFVSCCKELTK